MGPIICQQCSLETYNDSDDFYDIEVCNHCGHIQNSNTHSIEKKNTHRSLAFLGVALALIGAFIVQTANWGQYFLSAIPLRTKTFIGLASAEDYSQLAKMCDALKKYECVEEMLLNKVDVAPENLEAWSELGILQFQRRNFAGAVDSLQYYTEAGGKDLYAHYIYAKSLSEKGEVDEAAQNYEKILAAKPNVLQTTVAKNYVDMLIRSGREKQARQVVASIRRKGSNASDFMRSEMRAYASLK